MDTAKLLASEWQSLKNQRQQLLEEGNQFKRKLNNLSAEPNIGQLLEEKSQLKKKAKTLEKKVGYHERMIKNQLNFIESRRRAENDKRLSQMQQRARDHLASLTAPLKKEKLPEAIMQQLTQHEERIIWEVEAPVDEVERVFRQEIAEEKQEQQVTQRMLDETLAHIAIIEENYRQMKKYLQEAIRETERRRHQLHEDSLQWASQDRGHLEWTLEHESLYRDDVIRRYRTRFPTDNLFDLLPPPVSQPVQVQNLPKARRKKNGLPLPAAVPKTAVSTPQTWRFFVTFNASDPGLELPQEPDKFLSGLQSALDTVAYHSLDVQLVYDKLLAVTRMTTQQRQEMHKVVEVEPLGWKILRVGRKHRLFLSIDEDECCMRFLPCPRKKSYTHR